MLKPWIVERRITILTGAPGTSKGKLVQALALARATGRPVLGLPPAPGPVLFWSAEQGVDEDDRVTTALCRGMGLTTADLVAPFLQINDPPLRFGAPGMFTPVLALVHQHPGLLVLI